MIAALKIVIVILLVFTALGIACAVWIGRRRDTPADPFSKPFGEMPGFSAEQLGRIAPLPRHDGDPLRRSFAVRRPHRRPCYGRACIRCGAATPSEFAAECIADPWSAR